MNDKYQRALDAGSSMWGDSKMQSLAAIEVGRHDARDSSNLSSKFHVPVYTYHTTGNREVKSIGKVKLGDKKTGFVLMEDGRMATEGSLRSPLYRNNKEYVRNAQNYSQGDRYDMYNNVHNPFSECGAMAIRNDMERRHVTFNKSAELWSEMA